MSVISISGSLSPGVLNTLSIHSSISSGEPSQIIFSGGLLSFGSSYKLSICCLFLITKLILYGVTCNVSIFGSRGICNALDTPHREAIALLPAIFLVLLHLSPSLYKHLQSQPLLLMVSSENLLLN